MRHDTRAGVHRWQWPQVVRGVAGYGYLAIWQCSCGFTEERELAPRQAERTLGDWRRELKGAQVDG